MVDVSSLGLSEPDQLNWDAYEEGGQSKPLPPAGRYKVVAPAEFKEANFTKGNKGQLVVFTDPTIADGPHKGYQARFQRASTTKYSNREGSPLGDYFKAHGMKVKPTSNAEYVNAVLQTAGRGYEIDVDWNAYDKDTKFSLDGMTKFPKQEDGTFQPWVNHPTATEADPYKPGETRPKRVWANLTIKRYVAKK